MAESALEDRLAEVDRLRAVGILTDSEHAARRRLVLNASVPQRPNASGGVVVLVLTVLGALVGVMMGLVALTVGGLGNELEDGSGDQVIGLGLSAIAAVVASVVFGLYVSGRNRLAMSWCLLGAAIWHLVSISAFGFPGFVFLILGATFAFVGRDG